MDTELKYTLITGGSMGIGLALAKECASRGMNLLLVARGGKALADASAEIRNLYSVKAHTLQTDLRETGGPRSILEWCNREGFRVNVLINNAGLGGTALFEESDPEYSDERIQLNIRALVLLCHLFIPELKSHNPAFILNIGSVSGYYPVAYKSVYAASKAFVMSFSRALKQELTGVSVTVVNANGVLTNADNYKRINSYSSLFARSMTMEASRVARIAVEGMLKGKLVVVPGFISRVLILTGRILPQGMRDRLIARIIRSEIYG